MSLTGPIRTMGQYRAFLMRTTALPLIFAYVPVLDPILRVLPLGLPGARIIEPHELGERLLYGPRLP